MRKFSCPSVPYVHGRRRRQTAGGVPLAPLLPSGEGPLPPLPAPPRLPVRIPWLAVRSACSGGARDAVQSPSAVSTGPTTWPACSRGDGRLRSHATGLGCRIQLPMYSAKALMSNCFTMIVAHAETRTGRLQRPRHLARHAMYYYQVALQFNF